jgi:hypothetical protein
MSTYGRQVLATTGRPVQTLANLDRADWVVGGITLDWATVTAVASADETYGDGTVVAVGKKGLPFGTILCAKEVQEVQSITVIATEGDFTVTGNSATSAAIAYNASAATAQAAIRALGGDLADVAVTFVRNRWTLTHADGTDGGTFVLRVTRGGITRQTAALAWNISAADLTAALVGLDNVGAAGAVATGTAGGPYTVVFAAALGDVALEVTGDLTADGGVLEGGIVLVNAAAGAYVLTYPASLGNVAAVTTTATGLAGGSATVGTVTAGDATGTYGPFVSSAIDGRASLTRGKCFILNESILEDDPAGGATAHPAVFDGGTVWKARLRVGGVNTTPLGGGNEPSWTQFESAFPRIRYAE